MVKFNIGAYVEVLAGPLAGQVGHVTQVVYSQVPGAARYQVKLLTGKHYTFAEQLLGEISND